MARRRKPGTPGKTTIPPEVVKTVTKRLQKAFKQTDEQAFSNLFIIAQQHFLYLEKSEHPIEIMAGLVEARFLKRGGAPRTPIGRMVWTGDVENWQLQLYKWSSEHWDEENEAVTSGGIPEDCLIEAIVGWSKYRI